MQAVATRMARELKLLQSEPPPGVWAGPKGDSVTELEAQIQGPADTVYEGGVFKLEVNIPARYPFEPPKVRFVTPIYHPNIDGEGRICLDILNMPPKGAWKPSLNVLTVLVSIGLLLAEPNPDDGLVADITQEFRHQRQVFDAKARQSTRRYAMQQQQEQLQGQAGAGMDRQSEEPQQQQQQQQGEGQAAGQATTSNAGDTEPALQQQQQQQEQEAQAGPDAGAATGQQAAKQGEQNENSGTAANLPAQDPAAAHCAGEAAAAPAKRPRLTLRK